MSVPRSVFAVWIEVETNRKNVDGATNGLFVILILEYLMIVSNIRCHCARWYRIYIIHIYIYIYMCLSVCAKKWETHTCNAWYMITHSLLLRSVSERLSPLLANVLSLCCRSTISTSDRAWSCTQPCTQYKWLNREPHPVFCCHWDLSEKQTFFYDTYFYHVFECIKYMLMHEW